MAGNFWDGNIPAPLKPVTEVLQYSPVDEFLGWKHPALIDRRDVLNVNSSETTWRCTLRARSPRPRSARMTASEPPRCRPEDHSRSACFSALRRARPSRAKSISLSLMSGVIDIDSDMVEAVCSTSI